MIDADVELRVRRWLATDAAAIAAPGALRARVLHIPVARRSTSSWWSRFASVPVMTGAVAAVTVAAFVLSGSFFTMFDRPPGTDGGLCNNRQLQRALDELRDSDGYRYLDTQQQQVLLSDETTSLENPVFGWEDSLTSTVSYLAPDRTHEVVTPVSEGLDRGYLEQVRIRDEQWQLRGSEGEPGWVRIEPWPFGNWAWGYVQNAMGLLGTPGIASIRFGTEQVPDGLTGEGGCTIAAPGEVETRIVAIRVAEDGRVSDIYLGPPAGATGNRDAFRNLIEMDYSLPNADEFVAPAEFIDEDVLYPEVSMPPQPTIGPLAPPEGGGWPPIELPLGGADMVGAYIGDVEMHEGRWIALGSGYDADNALQAFVWTSTDARTWDLVPPLTQFTGMSMAQLEWNGESYLAVGYRTQERREDGTAPPDRPETWLSSDGLTWEPGGMFEAGANPNGPIWTQHGWVAGGSIWSEDMNAGTAGPTAGIQRPAFFSSTDGVTWTTHQPPEIAYGSVGVPVVQPDGSLSATSCETPELTNQAAASPCFVREWTSTDGVTWTAGPATEDTGDGLVMTPAGDEFLAIRYSDEAGEPELVRSDDGRSWQPVALPSDSIWPAQVVEVPDGVVLIGHDNTTPLIIASAWRSSDAGRTWEALPLGVLPGAVGLSADQVVATDQGLRIFGGMYLDETSTVPVVWAEP